jgi:hypothetical protein
MYYLQILHEDLNKQILYSLELPFKVAIFEDVFRYKLTSKDYIYLMKIHYSSNSIFISNLYSSMININYGNKKSLYKIIENIENLGSCNYEYCYKDMMDLLIENPHHYVYYINNPLFTRIDLYMENYDFYILVVKNIPSNVFDKHYLSFATITSKMMEEFSILLRSQKLIDNLYLFDGILCFIYILDVKYIPDHFLDFIYIYKSIIENTSSDNTDLFIIYLEHIKNKIDKDLIKKSIRDLSKDKITKSKFYIIKQKMLELFDINQY